MVDFKRTRELRSQPKSTDKVIKASYSGAEGLRKSKEVEEQNALRKESRQLTQGQPFRFYVPVGMTKEAIVVDDEIDFFRHEHAIEDKRTGKYSIFCPCINEVANCPACKALDRPSYYAMYLTVIDLDSYVNKAGENVPWSKKLLVVKSGMHKKLIRVHQKHGTLRGALLSFTRDGERDSAVGNDIEFIEFIPEEELESYATTYTDQKGKTQEILGYEPFNYQELFPDVTEQQIRAIVGGRPEPGSRDEQEESGTARHVRQAPRPSRGEEPAQRNPTARRPLREVEGEPEEATKEQEEEKPARSTVVKNKIDLPVKAAPRAAPKKAEPEEDVEDVEYEEEIEEEAPPARPARKLAAVKEAPVAVRKKAPVAEEEEVEEEIEEETKPVRAARTNGAAVNVRKARAAEPEEEEPKKPATSALAARRAALRRGTKPKDDEDFEDVPY